MDTLEILQAIDAHASEFGLKTSTIGQNAVKSRYAYERIKNGTAHRKTERKVLAWIEKDREARTNGSAA